MFFVLNICQASLFIDIYIRSNYSVPAKDLLRRYDLFLSKLIMIFGSR